MKIHYLGPRLTWSELAAETLAMKITENPAELSQLKSVEAAARKVVGGSDLGVIAYYNYLEGLVQECLDSTYEKNLRIVDAQRIKIVHTLGKYHGSEDYSKIYSHPKALAQCSNYLYENYEQSSQIPAASTTSAIPKIKEEKKGLVIARKEAIAEAGLKVIAEDIGNKKNDVQNYTDFYLVSDEKMEREYETKYTKGNKYLTMVAITPHTDKVGLLADIVGQIAYHGLNNAKIHSRPAIANVKLNGTNEPQMFYLEIEAHQDSIDLQKCIDALKYKLTPKGTDAEVVRVLGTYKKPSL